MPPRVAHPRDYGENAPSQHPAMGVGPEILSDTMGVDFGP